MVIYKLRQKQEREEIKEATKRIYENLMEEERRIYLECNVTRGNGYYTRSLLTPADEIEELRVPRTRDGEFSPAILPYRRRASFELGEVVLHTPGLARAFAT